MRFLVGIPEFEGETNRGDYIVHVGTLDALGILLNPVHTPWRALVSSVGCGAIATSKDPSCGGPLSLILSWSLTLGWMALKASASEECRCKACFL